MPERQTDKRVWHQIEGEYLVDYGECSGAEYAVEAGKVWVRDRFDGQWNEFGPKRMAGGSVPATLQLLLQEVRSFYENAYKDWRALYEQLLETLAEFGKNDPFGTEGDYWLIDDPWEGRTHKIEVVNPDFWSDAVHQRIRQTLANSFPHWGLVVVFSDKASGKTSVHRLR